MKINAPVGIFDSGLGGLTVAKKILDRLPSESIAYLGDEINIPYGERTPEEIRSLALGICEFLIGQEAKIIVMACNMSTATALDVCREAFPTTPIIGVIQGGARAAAKSTKGGPIGVLATTGTVKTKAYTKAIRQLIPDAKVIEKACPLFVPLVEAGKWDSDEAQNVAESYLRPLMAEGCKTFILGCTHYPYLADPIRRIIGPDAILIDPSEETAAETANILLETNSLNPLHAEPVHSYFTTARPDRFAELGSRFLARAICNVERISWGIEMRTIACQEKMVEATTRSGRST